jgi:hypothetical protein
VSAGNVLVEPHDWGARCRILRGMLPVQLALLGKDPLLDKLSYDGPAWSGVDSTHLQELMRWKQTAGEVTCKKSIKDEISTYTKHAKLCSTNAQSILCTNFLRQITTPMLFCTPIQSYATQHYAHLHINRPPGPYNLPILVYQRGKRDHEHANEAQQTVPPPQPKRLVHAVASERQHGAEEAPDARHACDGAGGVLREGVDEVGLDGNEDAHHSQSKR